MSTVSFSLELCQLEGSCHLDTDDSSWLRLEGTKLFSKGRTENQATKERGFQGRTRKRFHIFHEEDMRLLEDL